MFTSKDFIETSEGLLFAVVVDGLESGKVRCFLRYALSANGWQKLATEAAEQLLQNHYPHYAFYSQQLDAHLHGVDTAKIVKHHSPISRLQALLTETATDPVIEDCQQLCQLLISHPDWQAHIGITGSLLPGVHNQNSDIDLVCYDRAVFQQLRLRLDTLLNLKQCQALDEPDWLDSYQRRGCSLSLSEYIWHEQRKLNKALFNGRKFDLSLVTPQQPLVDNQRQKAGTICIRTTISDDSLGFDYPAEFKIQHPEIASVLVFTATYVGQAQIGEQVEIAGQLELDHQGVKRIIVGSSREAIGEYIKVCHD